MESTVKYCKKTNMNVAFFLSLLEHMGGNALATWVTHFRIAEQLLKKKAPVSTVQFLVGNIGPDCGLIGQDGTPTPPKQVTHFLKGKKIDAERFYEQYLNDVNDIEQNKYSYLLGYYVHLLTDQLWSKQHQQKKLEAVHQKVINRPDYNNLLKKDWYGLDFLYLATHKDHIFWTEFQHISAFPEYLDIFPQGQTFTQIKNITKFYLKRKPYEDHEFIYLTAGEVDQFVVHTTQEIYEMLDRRMSWNVL